MTPIKSRTSFFKRSGCLIAAIVLTGTSLFAHDMWIEPTAFMPEVGTIVGARLRVGQDFLGDPIRRDSKLIEQFVSLDGSGRKPLVGRDGSDPAGLVRIADPGMTILGYQSNASPVALGADKFNQYLKEEGLDNVAAMRARRNETGKEAREVFTRCAKSLVMSGAPAAPSLEDKDRRLGFTLELVAEKNPYTLGTGGELPLTLTYEGRPLAGTLVVAINRLNPAAKLSARTDPQGRVKFRLADRGAWLIKAVHMVPAAAESNADWQSYWASLTFELKASGAGK